MEANYVIDPLKSFLTVAFPNSGFTQPAYESNPDKRKTYAQKVLRAYRPGSPVLDEHCIFTGRPAAGVSLDVKDELPPGRTFRQHIPLITGEDVINFHPYGDVGLLVSGEALLAIHAFPLGCAKVGGRLLAVHADDPDVTCRFARRFLGDNRKAIQMAQLAGEKKLPESPHRAGTLLVETLLSIEQERLELREEGRPVSITAYHLSNSGQGVALDIYHLPLEITEFLRAAMSARYRTAWDAIRTRGWELIQLRRSKKKENVRDSAGPRFNVLYEDLLGLPDNAAAFIRRYFLRRPQRSRLPGDPRATYSLRDESHLVSWDLTELFLRKVVTMEQDRINRIRDLGDALADYVNSENDRRFFHAFLTARRYDDLRAALIRVNVARLRGGRAPVISFDPYVVVFEQGEELPYSDWRLARDLVLIRMIERLHALGWIQAHTAELPEPEAVAEEA